MIIKRFTMHNFGIYAGTNTFEFNSYKPIVLIGGMNGRGKTTFLEAILLALYGPNSFAYSESNYKSYNQYLRSYVNRNDASQTCYVELEFEIDNEIKEKYLVRREWDSVSKRTNEVITVKKDYQESEFLSKNWAMFVENILPSALSSFFFFDGEKIANLAVDETNDQLKESIRSMLGISILDVLNNDLTRNIKKIGKENKTSEAAERVQKLREAKDSALQDLNKVDQEILKIEDKIAKDNDQLVTLHQKYIARGGDAAEQRQKTLDQRAKVNAEYASNEEQLMVLASGELPLALVRDLIMEIKLQAEDEHDEAILKQSLSQISVLFDEFKSTYTENADAGSKFIEYISRNVEDNVTEPLYQLSDLALFQTNSLAESKIEESLKVARATISSKRKLKRQLDEFDSYLSVDVNETELTEIYGKIKKAEQICIEDKVKLSALQQERTSINSRVISSTAEFNQAVEKYLSQAETQDETDRTIKYTNMAMHILDKYMIALQTRKTDVLGQTITECYKKLANKKNLIDTIVMDPMTLDLKYLSSQGKEVPKSSLSAGEKQLMVIAILWALAICSKKKLPVIIDTPLSRLDSLHRTALIKTYFPNASAQTIILSTDSEIDQSYYQMMVENVGDEFTLDYDELTKSTTIRRGYF
ncbi:DNA sulfur modification protein DndD [Anaerocolumna xylanovorans]|uniref:Nuclease SbcCD subunit C n=1 Tax=Anaerocolumna xylanovorans DSM 12503 TaxID=1121345 RepID=A0A1M7YL98_9FIRM|nr:DNA sulfur modification protein DndD [Anaerocolumna xylanovorans]SHO53390.1 DNA sulfur modification protein DndD [Anaerocolumna xylanovorans DSM 12503]